MEPEGGFGDLHLRRRVFLQYALLVKGDCTGKLDGIATSLGVVRDDVPATAFWKLYGLLPPWRPT